MLTSKDNSIAIVLVVGILLCLTGAPGSARAASISTADGLGADATVSENDGASGGSGTSGAINARFSNATRNEYIFLRFDLSASGVSSVGQATLNLTSYRNDTKNFTIRAYGLNDDVAGQNWNEATIKFATAPALVFDGNSTTRGLVGGDVTTIGDWTLPNMSKGDLVSFTDADLATFLNADTDGLVTLILERRTVNTGQSRFASKEATALDGGSPTGPAGTWAPRLDLVAPVVHTWGGSTGDISVSGNWSPTTFSAGNAGHTGDVNSAQARTDNDTIHARINANPGGAIRVDANNATLSNAHLAGGRMIVWTSGSGFTLRGQVTLDPVAGNVFQIGSQSGAILTLDAKLTGSGDATKTSPGRLHLTNAANDFTGTLFVDEGQLRAVNVNALNTGSVQINAAGNLRLESTTATTTVPDLTLNGGKVEVATGGTVTHTLAGQLHVASPSQVRTSQSQNTIRIASLMTGSAALDKAGDGTVFITNAGNTFDGDVTVSEGTLIVDGLLGGSNIAIASGAAMGGTGVLRWNLDGDTGDLIDVNGTLDITGLDLVFDVTGGQTVGAEYVVADFTGADTPLGPGEVFAGVTTGPGFLFEYRLGDQQIVATKVIPEPSTFVMATLGLLGLGRYRRRRRKLA